MRFDRDSKQHTEATRNSRKHADTGSGDAGFMASSGHGSTSCSAPSSPSTASACRTAHTTRGLQHSQRGPTLGDCRGAVVLRSPLVGPGPRPGFGLVSPFIRPGGAGRPSPSPGLGVDRSSSLPLNTVGQAQRHMHQHDVALVRSLPPEDKYRATGLLQRLPGVTLPGGVVRHIVEFVPVQFLVSRVGDMDQLQMLFFRAIFQEKDFGEAALLLCMGVDVDCRIQTRWFGRNPRCTYGDEWFHCTEDNWATPPSRWASWSSASDQSPYDSTWPRAKDTALDLARRRRYDVVEAFLVAHGAQVS